MTILHNTFEHLGYSVVGESSCRPKLRLYTINNNDGTPRWIWPACSSRPVFLKFYHQGSIRSRLFWVAIQVVFFLRLQRLFFSSTTISLVRRPEAVANLEHSGWALFTGTPGPNNKSVLFDGWHFFKIANTPSAMAILLKEAMSLTHLYTKAPAQFTIPEVALLNKRVLKVQDLSTGGRRRTQFSPQHIAAIGELSRLTGTLSPLSVSLAWQKARAGLAEVQQQRDPRIPNGLLRKMAQLMDQQENITCDMALSHGDFTPWNMYEKGGKLAIYDWELAQPLCPVGFDAFHFMIQNGILVERKSWKLIKADIERHITPEVFKEWTATGTTDVHTALKLYLLINTAHYLYIYSQQPQWHTQVNWLLDTWNEALSDLWQESFNHRELLIMDTFSFLQPKPYAALKFHQEAPETLSPYSDIDLCMARRDADSLFLFLKQHPLVAKANRTRKSFMDTLELVMNDGSVLYLDLIAQLKWKYLEIMPIEGVIERATMNPFGVKMAAHRDTALFIAHFYGLNNAPVPEKYMPYQAALSSFDDCRTNVVFSGQKVKELLRFQLVQTAANQGFSGLKNRFLYLVDTLKNVLGEKGLVITFSGVDGAGKSTVIEQVQQEFEKKFRKKVVVLRHRPSVLPILSAWTKGKAQAERASTERLPRQGTNHNLLSSLLRFGYYYLDYLLGQFYVYFKYVRRGYVVLYDRYYFDFINDSRRSNISLPKGLLKAGYALLMSPKYNFFLYADPDTILKRKQELDAGTIRVLTQAYLSLFRQLGTHAAGQYIPVENRDLNTTIRQITALIRQ